MVARFKKSTDLCILLSTGDTITGTVTSDRSDQVVLKYDHETHKHFAFGLKTTPEYIVIQKEYIVLAVVDEIDESL
jgi:hypothetical protein